MRRRLNVVAQLVVEVDVSHLRWGGEAEVWRAPWPVPPSPSRQNELSARGVSNSYEAVQPAAARTASSLLSCSQ